MLLLHPPPPPTGRGASPFRSEPKPGAAANIQLLQVLQLRNLSSLSWIAALGLEDAVRQMVHHSTTIDGASLRSMLIHLHPAH